MADSASGYSPDGLYAQTVATYGEPLERLARAYEANPDARRDLLQEIHLSLWRSFHHFEQRCSLRTWVYQVAHNTAASHILRERRNRVRLVSLDERSGTEIDRGEIGAPSRT